MTDSISKSQAKRIAAITPRVYDMATPYTLPPFAGMTRAYSEAGQGVPLPGGARTPQYFGGWPPDNKRPVIKLVEQGARMYGSSIVAYDIEGPLTHSHKVSAEQFKEAIAVKIEVLAAAREANPRGQFGVYATIPQDQVNLAQYAEAKRVWDLKQAGKDITGLEWWAAKYPEYDNWYQKWREVCGSCTALAKVSDFVTYVAYVEGESTDESNDIRHDGAIALGIEAAKKFGRPVYAYVSMYRYEQTAKGEVRHAIGEKRFEAQMRLLKSLGVNVFVWAFTNFHPLNGYETACMKIAVKVYR